MAAAAAPAITREARMDLSALVEPDRVHKTVYTDQQIFDREMARIWERIWVYCGHESQVPNAGDYYAVTIGRQPMVMVRQKDGSVQVLYNRCPHRGVQLFGNLKGNTGSSLRLLVPRVELSPRRQRARDPARQGLRRHAHDARQPRLRHEARGAGGFVSRLRLRQPGRRRARRCPSSSARPRSPSTTCATARRSARSRSCRSATA